MTKTKTSKTETGNPIGSQIERTRERCSVLPETTTPLELETNSLQRRWANLARLRDAIASGRALYDRELAVLSAAGELDSEDSKSLRRRK